MTPSASWSALLLLVGTVGLGTVGGCSAANPAKTGTLPELDANADTATHSATDTSNDTSADSATDSDVDSSADTSGPPPTSLDLHHATLFDDPANLADWPVTTHITLVEFAGDVHVEFDKLDGEGRWPDVTPPGWDGPLQYTLGLAEYIDGQWYASAAIQYGYG